MNTEQNKIHVYGYARCSGLGQVNGDTFNRQREEIERYCNDNNLELVKIYEEQGVSGTKCEEDRPQFMDMIEAMLASYIRYIIIEGIDRLSRDMAITDQLITYLASKGVTLISARTGDDVTEAYSGDPMRRAMIQMQSIFAELEKSLLVKKLRTARERKRNQGIKCEGRKGTEEINPDLINYIRKLRDEKMPWRKIVDELNGSDRLTLTGKKWTLQHLYAVYNRATKSKLGNNNEQ
jgi:DNA invertase Pin-like site-specific DNA recombinase